MSLDKGADRFQYGSMESAFFQAGRIPADFRPAFQSGDAAPDDLLSPMNVPGYPTEVAAAVAADQPFRQRVFAGEPASVGFGFLGVSRLLAVSTGDFFLDSEKRFPWDNGGMMIPEVVLCELPVVLLDFALDKISGVGFLKEDVAHVFFIL